MVKVRCAFCGRTLQPGSLRYVLMWKMFADYDGIIDLEDEKKHCREQDHAAFVDIFERRNERTQAHDRDRTDDDDSGVLRYVRVEFAGQLVSPDNELNGIALQAVGRGTVIDHVQVHHNADDGIEFFGGKASFKHALTTGIGDDNLDWTDGWQGRGQFLVAQQRAASYNVADNGIEADGALLVEDESGTLRRVISGDVSIRMLPDARD